MEVILREARKSNRPNLGVWRNDHGKEGNAAVDCGPISQDCRQESALPMYTAPLGWAEGCKRSYTRHTAREVLRSFRSLILIDYIE